MPSASGQRKTPAASTRCCGATLATCSSGADTNAGPRGAQGVPLTPGRSIAVDRESIPYGTPLWLSTTGPAANLNRMVVAQDTGTAIKGAVRADYFAGWSQEAADLAHRLKQPLNLWVLWPR